MSQPDDWTDLVAADLVTHRPDHPPLIRTIDITADHPAFDLVWQQEKPDFIFPGLTDQYGRSLKDLRRVTMRYVQALARELVIRDDIQYRDISNIAAHALRSTAPDSLVLGVAQGAAHLEVGRRLEREGLSVDWHWIHPLAPQNPDLYKTCRPEQIYLPNVQMGQKAAYAPDELTEGDIDRLIAYEFTWTYLTKRSGLGSSELPFIVQNKLTQKAIASGLVRQLDDRQVQTLLEGVATRQFRASIPGMRKLRAAIAVNRAERFLEQFLQTATGDLDQIIGQVATEFLGHA